MLTYLSTVWDQVTDFFSYWFYQAKDIAVYWYARIRTIALDWWGQLSDLTGWMFGRILEFVYYWYDALREYIVEFTDNLRTISNDWWMKMVDIFVWTWWLFRDLIDNLYRRIREFVIDLYWNIRSLAGSMINQLRTYVYTWYSFAIILFNTFWGYLLTLIYNWWVQLGDWLNNHYTNMVTFLRDELPLLRVLFDPAHQWKLTEFFNDPGRFVMSYIADLIIPWLDPIITRLAYPHDPEEWE